MGDEESVGVERIDLDMEVDVDAVIDAWTSRGSRLDVSSRRAVVAAVIHSLNNPGAPSRGWIDALYLFDPGLVLSIDDARALRVVLHEQLVVPRRVERALETQHQLGLLLDDLISDAARRRLSVLEETAMLDPLTGLMNRRAFEPAFEAAVANARRHGRPLSLAMADLDGLKNINDTKGHGAGDAALRSFAGAILASLRGGDNAFRFGGDEFVVLAPDTTSEGLTHLFERLGDSAPAFSVGIAELPCDGKDAATLVGVADERLYAARRSASTAHSPQVLDRAHVALVALALGTVGALVAESVRRVAGIHPSGQGIGAWVAILFVAPIMSAMAAAARGETSAPDAVRRAGAFAGLTTLVLVAAMTPLFLRASLPDGPGRRGAGRSPQLATRTRSVVSTTDRSGRTARSGASARVAPTSGLAVNGAAGGAEAASTDSPRPATAGAGSAGRGTPGPATISRPPSLTATTPTPTPVAAPTPIRHVDTPGPMTHSLVASTPTVPTPTPAAIPTPTPAARRTPAPAPANSGPAPSPSSDAPDRAKREPRSHVVAAKGHDDKDERDDKRDDENERDGADDGHCDEDEQGQDDDR